MTTPIPSDITLRELKLLKTLQDIVMETMQYPLHRPLSSDSHLPEALIDKAQAALAAYGMNLLENRPAQEVAA